MHPDMPGSQHDDFDFETWRALASEDPERFEQMRQDAIRQIIESAPPTQRERLQALQWRIDQERRLSGNPLAACLRISNLMWERLMGKNGLVDTLNSLGQASEQHVEMREQAPVLPFRPRASDR
jgi:hypothetical protein